MIPRQAEGLVQRRLSQFPAVALVGPRQCGKTTLARALGGSYFDLEQETDRLRLDLDWPRLMAEDGRVVLDEAQVWPEILVSQVVDSVQGARTASCNLPWLLERIGQLP